MSFDRSQIRKGMFMTSTPGVPARHSREALRAEFPMFADTLAAAGPGSGPEFERQQRGIKELTERLQQVRKQLESYKARK